MAECWKNWYAIKTLNVGGWKRVGLAARVRQIGRVRIRQHEYQLVQSGLLRSDDEHVLALALASGARLLYTDDRRLQRDFENPAVVPGLTGRIYTSRPDGRFTAEHQELLQAEDLCPDAEAC